jgi:hypothetical protein
MQKSEAVKTSDTLQPWQLFTLAGLIGATIVVFMSRGQTPAGVILLSLLVFAAAAVGFAALRAFLPLTQRISGDEPQILGGRTRAALEREKTLVLRSIKELEFDRAMRKVSERDFAEMSGRLRARAARLLRQLDAGSLYRAEIEKEIERRLGGARPGSGGPASPGVAAPRHTAAASDSNAVGMVPPASGAEGGPAAPASLPSDATCASCSTRNDPDARFCKGCGARLEGMA